MHTVCKLVSRGQIYICVIDSDKVYLNDEEENQPEVSFFAEGMQASLINRYLTSSDLNSERFFCFWTRPPPDRQMVF